MLAIGMYAGLYTKGQKSKNGIYASGEEYSMTNSNREFRKIPSLKFLFEISTDGRIVRNVKSKKQCKVFKKEDGYYTIIRGKEYPIKSLLEEKPICESVVVSKNGVVNSFGTKKAAASFIYLHSNSNSKFETIKSKLKEQRSHILGYDIKYSS